MTGVAAIGPLQVGSGGRRGVGWWGVLSLIATEGALFVYLLFSYAYLAVQLPPSWMPTQHPKLLLAGPNTVILLLSSLAVWFGEMGMRRRKRRMHLTGFALAILLGVVFLVVQYFEWKSKPFTMRTGPYGSLFFTITGFHMAHVIVGVILLSFTLLWSLMGYFDSSRHGPVMVSAIYWHFVDVVWLAVFFTLYLSPYLL